MLRAWLLGVCLVTTAALAEPVDNCASLLGSISVELRYARTLPPGTRTTFVCPKDTSALIGASKQRIINSLGVPDAVAGAPLEEAGAQSQEAGAPLQEAGAPSEEAGAPSQAEGVARGSSIAASWSYFFASAHSTDRGPGIPELIFSFDLQQQVSAISCQKTR